MAKAGKGTKSDQLKTQSRKEQKPTSFSLSKKLFFIFSIAAGLASYWVYNWLTTHPELPKVDTEQWWGPYPIDPKPDTSIRPFQIHFDDVMVDDLRSRILHTRPFPHTVFQYGFNTHLLSQILDYWKNKYDFREREDFFNRYDHFKTRIQGLDIHFMRVQPQVDRNVTVLPLLLVHGWPSSFREYYDMVPLLTSPAAERKFVFEVIVPSLPGFGYSQGSSTPGLGPAQTATILHSLMTRLGHSRYYVQSGDSLGVAAAAATLFPRAVLGYHAHAHAPDPQRPATLVVQAAAWLWPSLVVERPELAERMYPLGEHPSYLMKEAEYLNMQATKADTIALLDSPAGLAAYILEKFSTWRSFSPPARPAAGGDLLSRFSLTQLLDNLMVYWATGSVATALNTYAETYSADNLALRMDEIPTPVPTACIKFKHSPLYIPDAVLKLKYTNYLQSTAVESGGHFATMESPKILAEDLFQAVEHFLEFHDRQPKQEPQVQKQEKPKQETQAPELPIWETAKTIYEFSARDATGRDVSLSRYRGHVTVIVNVATHCGLTHTNYQQLNELYDKYSATKEYLLNVMQNTMQIERVYAVSHTNYQQLNELYDKYSASKGLRILAFPCNQFGGQEPGSLQEILKFTKDRGVRFDLFEKVEVNGENAHPLWKFLKRTQGGTLGDFIKWNFSKFIVDKNGVPVERLAPTVNPVDMVPYLEKYW